MQSLALLGLPVLAKSFGFNGVQWALAATAGLIALLCLRLPRKAPMPHGGPGWDRAWKRRVLTAVSTPDCVRR